MKATEFYKTPDGTVMYKRFGFPVKELHQGDREIITEMLSIIRIRYPDAFKSLCKQYTVSELNRVYYEFNIVSRFIRCNFGEYDAQRVDIDDDGFFHFEEVGCPLRGECKYEGIICKPKLDKKLTSREIDVVRHIVKGLRTSEIAEELNISPTTVNRHRENIKAKLGVRTIAQLATYYCENLKEKDV